MQAASQKPGQGLRVGLQTFYKSVYSALLLDKRKSGKFQR